VLAIPLRSSCASREIYASLEAALLIVPRELRDALAAADDLTLLADSWTGVSEELRRDAWSTEDTAALLINLRALAQGRQRPDATCQFGHRSSTPAITGCAAPSGDTPGRWPDQRCGRLTARTLPARAILAVRDDGRVALQRMDNVGIVVESLDAAISFFAELGLELEGRAMIEGDWSGRVTGLRDQRVETAMMRMPDGHGRIELSRFLTPPPVADHRNAPVNALGYLRVMFAVDDLDDTLSRLREHGAQLVDEVVQYQNVYRLCYVRGPEGILIGLAEQIG
jgi:catechol 2,3-dioxygenase-like lactoylglutathione lyase family enzyme